MPEADLQINMSAMRSVDSKAIDLLLSNCRFWTQCFRSCFWYDGPIMEKGLPKMICIFRIRSHSAA